MKKFLFLVLSIVLFANFLSAQTKEREFGVIVFYTKGGGNHIKHISINNITVINFERGVLYHKVYSSGEALINASSFGNSLNSNTRLLLNDTVYVRVLNRDVKLNVTYMGKAEAIAEIEYEKEERKDYEILYSKERINYPYIPESFENDKKTGKRIASGFLLSKEGYIITNYHVIENTKKVVVRGVNNNKNSSLSASIVYTDSINDLALLKLDDKITIDPPVYTLRKTPCEIGENIFVLGYPLTNAMGEDIKLTDGLISSQNGYKGDTTSYQISAPVQPGNSGAPLFDKNGTIVGVINAKLSGAENATYAIKMKQVFEAVQKAGITIPQAATNSLAGKPLTQQVKAIQDFVYIVEAE